MAWPLANLTSRDDGARRRLREEHERKAAATADSWRDFETARKQAEQGGRISASDHARLEVLYTNYAGKLADERAAESSYRGFLESELAHTRPDASVREGTELLQRIKSASFGDSTAQRKLAEQASVKGWLAGTDSAGGFLIQPEQLAGYVAARRAASPLRDRCSNFTAQTNEVLIVAEANSVSVSHVAEAATKPNSTGSVAQKISTIHKAAGVSYLSDELLADTAGLAGNLVGSQYAQQIGITIDSAIISGTGTGQPTGIRNAAGVTATPVDAQGGSPFMDSILKAESRLAQKFFEVDTIVIHPRDLVKFTTAKDTSGLYIFAAGIGSRFPNASVIVDANIPTNLGAATNESVIIVGAFRPGAYFFSRQALIIEASRDAGWTTDETVFRAVERYGFAVVIPGAFEVLTGLLP